MEFQVNRYYKDERVGYVFARKNECFADKRLCAEIQTVFESVIKNRDVTAWISCVVRNSHDRPYLVFGHNRMYAQEHGFDRLSGDFLFAATPFSEELREVGNVEILMKVISDREGTLSMEPLLFTPKLNGNDNQEGEKLAEALASALVDQNIKLSVTAPLSCCESMLSQVWRKMPFPECMPTIALVDAVSAEMPQCRWTFAVQNRPQALCVQLEESPRLKNASEEEKYLIRAGKVILGTQNPAFREMYHSPMAQKNFDEKIGQENSTFRKQLMIWNFAIENSVEAALPTEAEKRWMLGKLK